MAFDHVAPRFQSKLWTTVVTAVSLKIILHFFLVPIGRIKKGAVASKGAGQYCQSITSGFIQLLALPTRKSTS